MTPALKAMVEAMADQMPGAMISNGEVLVTGAGWVNLEKVARAGLEALREPDKLMEEAALAEEGCGCPCCVSSDDWEAMIDAILGEKP